MKHSPLFLLLLLMTLPGFALGEIPAAALHFNRLALGNVARVLSARFKTAVTITANADAPITGDFSSLDLPQALREAARQAHLMVLPTGPGGQPGYTLSIPSVAAAGALPAQPDPAAAQKRREQLLRQRAVLLDQAARLDH